MIEEVLKTLHYDAVILKKDVLQQGELEAERRLHALITKIKAKAPTSDILDFGREVQGYVQGLEGHNCDFDADPLMLALNELEVTNLF